jgi:hypothetical protein
MKVLRVYALSGLFLFRLAPSVFPGRFRLWLLSFKQMLYHTLKVLLSGRVESSFLYVHGNRDRFACKPLFAQNIAVFFGHSCRGHKNGKLGDVCDECSQNNLTSHHANIGEETFRALFLSCRLYLHMSVGPMDLAI